MNSTATINTDNFSWERTMMVARYYYPALRLQLMLYPAVSAAVGIVTFFMFNSPIWTIFGGLLTFVLQLMLYIAPIAFTIRSNRAIETMLPAKWQEKATFILLYTFIVIPILVYVPKYLCHTLLSTFITGNSLMLEINKISNEISSFYTYFINIVQELVPLATCLFVVVWRNSNRALLGSVWAIVSLVVMAIIGGIIGFFMVFRSGVANDILMHPEMAETPNFAIRIADSLYPYMLVFGLVCLIYVGLMIYFTARRFKTAQF